MHAVEAAIGDATSFQSGPVREERVPLPRRKLLVAVRVLHALQARARCSGDLCPVGEPRLVGGVLGGRVADRVVGRVVHRRELVLRRDVACHACDAGDSVGECRRRLGDRVLLEASVLLRRAALHGRQPLLVHRLVLLECPLLEVGVRCALDSVRLAYVVRGPSVVALHLLVCSVVPILTGLVSVDVLRLRHACAWDRRGRPVVQIKRQAVVIALAARNGLVV